MTHPQVEKLCEYLHPGAHLIAVNSQQEHDAVRAYMTAANLACTIMWTSGKTDNPQGLTDWYWDLRTFNQDITYIEWSVGDPNNGHPPIENVLVLLGWENFKFADAPIDLSFASGLCSLCEIDLA